MQGVTNFGAIQEGKWIQDAYRCSELEHIWKTEEKKNKPKSVYLITLQQFFFLKLYHFKQELVADLLELLVWTQEVLQWSEISLRNFSSRWPQRRI